jgi:HlyD family secretion protein
MIGQQGIFRKVALERLSSPEQLDTVMQVTGPRSWIGLGGLLLLLVTVVIWGWLGSIPTRVQAQGVLLRRGGVFDVFSVGTGPITDLLVSEGEEVRAGQLLARVDQPDLVTQIRSAEAELAEREAEHATLVAVSGEGLTLRNDSLALQEAKLKGTISFAEGRLAALEEQIRSQELLLEQGLVVPSVVLAARQEAFAARDLLERSRTELKQVPLERLTARTSADQDLVRSLQRISEVRRRIAALREQHTLASTIAAPYPGRVLEVKRRRGDLITAGSALASLQIAGGTGEGLQAIIYVPPQDGKNIERGQQAQISPYTARREEFGFLVGRITYVSEFPATPEGMRLVLRNEGLVQTLSAQGPPFAVYADLVSDPASRSGYLWSSTKGSALRVDAGTLCYVTVTVRRVRPVEMVIPLLREITGLY